MTPAFEQEDTPLARKPQRAEALKPKRITRGKAPDDPKPPKPGPPPPYTSEYTERVREASRIGYTRYEIGRLLDVTQDTLLLWEMMYVSFADALVANMKARTERVGAAFFQRSVGYEYPSEQIVKTSDDAIMRVPTMKHIPADPVAAEKWLKYHKPEVYARVIEEGAEANTLRIVIENDPDTASKRAPPVAPRQPEGDDDA